LSGYDLLETGVGSWQRLWLRGGFPRSFHAKSDKESIAWRDGYIRMFLERDLHRLGISIPFDTLRRFWTMLANDQGQVWNSSRLARSMSLSDKTVRSYLDILTGTFMVRQLQPWNEDIGKRQVKSPKIYLRDSGLLHRLLGLRDYHGLTGHPQVGVSWEGFVIEQVFHVLKLTEAFFWATHNGAEIDLFFAHKERRYGVEITFHEAPMLTKSMQIGLEDLDLTHLWVIYPGENIFPLHNKVTALPLTKIAYLPLQIR
jgi:predicted AAA+ superfamily ATPase